MPNNVFYFLRHAETEKNPDMPAVEWTLSPLGQAQSEAVAENESFTSIDVVISSCERKAFETAWPLADKLGKEVIRMEEFNEVERGGKFLSREEFDRLKREKLEDLGCKKDGGESGREAIERIKKGINVVDCRYSGKNIMIVSHGTILSLYFAEITDSRPEIYERWKALKFCSWGKVRNGFVEKDINA